MDYIPLAAMEFITKIRGARFLIHQGYNYTLNQKTAHGQTRWLCQDRTCPGREMSQISMTSLFLVTATPWNCYYYSLFSIKNCIYKLSIIHKNPLKLSDHPNDDTKYISPKISFTFSQSKYHVTVDMYHRFVYVSQVTGQVSLSQCIYLDHIPMYIILYIKVFLKQNAIQFVINGWTFRDHNNQSVWDRTHVLGVSNQTSHMSIGCGILKIPVCNKIWGSFMGSIPNLY